MRQFLLFSYVPSIIIYSAATSCHKQIKRRLSTEHDSLLLVTQAQDAAHCITFFSTITACAGNTRNRDADRCPFWAFKLLMSCPDCHIYGDDMPKTPSDRNKPKDCRCPPGSLVPSASPAHNRVVARTTARLQDEAAARLTCRWFQMNHYSCFQVSSEDLMCCVHSLCLRNSIRRSARTKFSRP